MSTPPQRHGVDRAPTVVAALLGITWLCLSALAIILIALFAASVVAV